MATRKAIQPAVDSASLAAQLREELDAQGFVKLGAIKPKASRAQLTAQLTREGFEVTRTVVRVPLRQQLGRALEHDGVVSLSSLTTYMQGATPAERKATVAALVAAGEAHRALRGEAEVLVASAAQVITGAELKGLARALTALTKAVAKAGKKPGAGLWRVDVETAVRALSACVAPSDRAPVAAPATETQVAAVVPVSSSSGPLRSNGGQFTELLTAMRMVRDPTTELSFIPQVVAKLSASMDAAAVQKLLLQAAAKDVLELRPEGGIDRLTEAELSVCPPGPHGTRLSWVRALGRGGA